MAHTTAASSLRLLPVQHVSEDTLCSWSLRTRLEDPCCDLSLLRLPTEGRGTESVPWPPEPNPDRQSLLFTLLCPEGIPWACLSSRSWNGRPLRPWRAESWRDGNQGCHKRGRSARPAVCSHPVEEDVFSQSQTRPSYLEVLYLTCKSRSSFSHSPPSSGPS